MCGAFVPSSVCDGFAAVAQATQNLKEARADCLQLNEEKEQLVKSLDIEKQTRTGGEQSLKIALRQQKKSVRDMQKIEKTLRKNKNSEITRWQTRIKIVEI